MSFRTWLYAQLTDPTDLVGRGLYGTRVFGKKSMRSSVEDHPYLVFKLGNATNLGLSEDIIVETQYFQIYVYDYGDAESGDYTQVDSIILYLQELLNGEHSSPDGLFTIEVLETSQDLEDSTLRAMLKYIRFQATVRRL